MPYRPQTGDWPNEAAQEAVEQAAGEVKRTKGFLCLCGCLPSCPRHEALLAMKKLIDAELVWEVSPRGG